MLDKDPEANLSISKQCDLLGLPRSTAYYKSKKNLEPDLKLMRIIDELYLKSPCFGSRTMKQELKRKGERVNRKKIQRLMKLMGIEAMYPKPRTTIGNKEHYKYPYLLNNVEIKNPNEVWGIDITYIPILGGYIYLVAILDLYSRFVVSWMISETLESDFCVAALEKALKSGVKPKILNSDQGSQFTSKNFIGKLKKHGIAISMSGKGRCWDNIFVERLWRSLKYENVYLQMYETKEEAQKGIDQYFKFYNEERLHKKLGYATPKERYYEEKMVA
jgi:putative transposase